jgi:hypothetical protein
MTEEKIRILRERARASNDPAVRQGLSDLESALSRLTWDSATRIPAAEETREVKQALAALSRTTVR